MWKLYNLGVTTDNCVTFTGRDPVDSDDELDKVYLVGTIPAYTFDEWTKESPEIYEYLLNMFETRIVRFVYGDTPRHQSIVADSTPLANVETGVLFTDGTATLSIITALPAAATWNVGADEQAIVLTVPK